MDLTVQIPKETADLVQGLTGFIKACKKALSDGWQPGQDIPVLMAAAISNLGPALEGFDKIGQEAYDNPQAMITAVGILSSEIYAAIIQ